ncbi:MAG TPA: 2-dehydropantoate 2-reductase [Planctomycetaceae bacterium]|nr:2-dehydropantoate 2-reductase [Planctomycetaceae bacterium]
MTNVSRENAPLSYAIIGSGALGGLYGGMLANVGSDVHFLINSGIDQIRRDGWTVESVLGDFHISGDLLNLHTDASSIPPCDVTIVAIKTTQNHLLPQLLSGSTSKDGVVLCLQNGLHSELDSVAVVGPDRVLGGCCFLCSNKIGPGHIRHIDYGRIVMGEFTDASLPPAGITARLQRITDDLRAAGIDANATGDLWMARWRKLMWNIPFNGLSVALNASTKELIDNESSFAIAESIMREVYDVAAAVGRKLPADAIELTLDHTRHMVPYDSSMRLDFLAGREMELRAIFEAPLTAAKRAGVVMSRVEMLHRQLAFLQSRADH